MPGLTRRRAAAPATGAPLSGLFGPLLGGGEEMVWPVGWFRCVACADDDTGDSRPPAASPPPVAPPSQSDTA